MTYQILKKGQIVKELIKLGISRGPALGLVRFHPKRLPEKIEYYKWLVKTGKAYSSNYLIKLAKSKDMGYYYDDYLRYKTSLKGAAEIEKIVEDKREKHLLEDDKLGEDRLINSNNKKKNIFKFIKDE